MPFLLSRLSSPWVSFVSSVLSMMTAGSLFTFSSFSEPLRLSLGYSAKDINMIASFGNTALYITFLFIGPFYDRFGPLLTMVIATALNGLGYGLMFLTYTQRIPGSAISMSIYYFLVGSAASCLYLVTVAVNLTNFSSQAVRGITLGILLLFYGLSATIYAQIFRYQYSNASAGSVDVGGFLLFLTISMVVINGISTLLIRKHVQPQRDTVVSVESNTLNPVVLDNISPFSILKTPSFWFFTLAVIWQQSLTYFSNVSIILKAISGVASTDSIYISNISSIHVTILSVFQSIGRFFGGVVSQYDSKSWYTNKRLILLCIDIFLFIPCAMLGFSSIDPIKLYVCSAMIGLGWGSAGGIFPGLIRSIFGMRFFGTANGFVLGGVPISIFICNYVFGVLYDTENALQGGVVCLGGSCFSTSYKIFAGIQVFTIAMALALVLQGVREANKEPDVVDIGYTVESLNKDGVVVCASEDTEMQVFADDVKVPDRAALRLSTTRLDSVKSGTPRLSLKTPLQDDVTSPLLRRVPSLVQVSMLNTSFAGSDTDSFRSQRISRLSLTQRKSSDAVIKTKDTAEEKIDKAQDEQDKTK